MSTTLWTRDHVRAITDDPSTWTPVIPDEGLPRVLSGYDVWDLWPVRTPDGALASVCGREVWGALSAPAVGHPATRHDIARIRLVARRPGEAWGWDDLGPLFPDGASEGSREWAASTPYDPETGTLTAYYTAAGVRGEAQRTFRQRIFSAQATVECVEGLPRLSGWTPHREAVVADGAHYVVVDQEDGEPGFIKAFRDPFPFRDPATGEDYLLFTGSMASSTTDFNGCIGIARRTADGYELLEALVTADGVNNELERPHVIVHEGRYLLFFSTQARTFHPDCPGPTGLYGLVADSLFGPYEPLNESGVILINPPTEPFQAYSWVVLPDLTTTGFVDSFAMHGRHPGELESFGPTLVRRHFGGTMTGVSQLRVDGTRAWVEQG